MAVYKVAQDVEADDKLLGPFSFRQFVYLIIVAISMGLAWGLSRVFIPLAIIPLPLIIFFGALALPLRKDQPMEVYLAALVSFYLKPRRRIWEPDGIESLIEITAPRVVEVQRSKDITQVEAEQRLSYLADIADTEGWAIRHAAEPFPNNSMSSDAFYAAQQTEDVLDENGGVSQSLGMMIGRADELRKQQAVERMQQQVLQPTQVVAPAASPAPITIPPIADPYASLTPTPAAQPQDATPTPQFNPYPTEIHQSVIQPLDSTQQLPQPALAPQPQPTPMPVAAPEVSQQNTPPSTSETPISPDIINLASNSDLSIETIQREANRIQEKEDKDDEVFISLH